MIDSKTIPKYVTELEIPPVFKPKLIYNEEYKKCTKFYEVDMVETKVQMLPLGYPKTDVYAYAGLVYSKNNFKGEYKATVPGPTFITYANDPIEVKWNNKIETPHIFPVDPTLHWANPNNMPTPKPPFKSYPPGYPLAQYPVPTVIHLHGGESESKYDGFPESWFTYDGKVGQAYETNVYRYLNEQQSSTLFYHDHALGITRLNVYAGLVGAYLLKDPCNYLDDECKSPLPTGKYDIPLIVQDRSFNEDGSSFFSADGDNPSTHPYWRRFFYGNTITVNGKTWPNLNVEQTAYRFRIVNASNSRFYKFKLSNNQKLVQIATDGGYLRHPAYMDVIELAPAERAEIVIDFSEICIGEEIILLNVTEDDETDKDTTGQVMKFKVKYKDCNKPICLPIKLNDIPKLQPNVSKRVVTLNSLNNDEGVQALFLNGQKWEAPVSENVLVGSIQIWEIVNLANGPHPIHIHLADAQLINRQKIDKASYLNDWECINGQQPLNHPTKIIDPDTYLKGEPIEPKDNENGWKDTIVCPPGCVTRLVLAMYPSRLDPCCTEPGKNLFPFDPSSFPGYVWHCHMLDHEDNEMMRPMQIINENDDY